jgi:hypothetical protein
MWSAMMTTMEVVMTDAVEEMLKKFRTTLSTPFGGELKDYLVEIRKQQM